MTRIKIALATGLLCTSFFSCEKETLNSDTNIIDDNQLANTIEYDYLSSLKKEFATALSKAVEKSQPLRVFLKEEALKMFDNDYDVLYHTIKNQKLSDGTTIRELLLQFYAEEAQLMAIENEIPTLTIMIPELPEDSFSADLWNTENEIPKIALSLRNTNSVPFFEADGTEFIFSPEKIPAFPVLVVKENERVVQESDTHKSFAKGSRFTTDKEFSFRFLDDRFDRSKNTPQYKALTTNQEAKVKTAYETYKSTDGWQRDYVYYNITPSASSGEFTYDYQEHLTSFRMEGNAMTAYNKIADQTNDPQLVDTTSENANADISAGWTGGYFEFKANVLINGKNGAGSETSIYIPIIPQNLFDLNYTYHPPVVGRGIRRPAYYTFESIAHKTALLDLPIFNWDLDQYATSIKISIEEVDLTETTVVTETRNAEFATNFEIKGTLLKVGLKYGASRKENETQTIQTSVTQGSDNLGDVIINFADDIIISKSGSTYTSRKYNNGSYSLGIEPRKVQ